MLWSKEVVVSGGRDREREAGRQSMPIRERERDIARQSMSTTLLGDGMGVEVQGSDVRGAFKWTRGGNCVCHDEGTA